MNEYEQGGFSVEALAVPSDPFVEAHAEEIRRLATRSSTDIVDIGKRLILVKQRVGRGAWLPWLNAEFGWSDETANRFMRVATTFGEIPQLVGFGPSALYLLASPSTPAEVRQHFVTQAESGEPVRYSDVRDAIQAARPEPLPQHVIEASVPCEDCGELFSEEVWHCAECDHHWPLGRDSCQNCHMTERPLDLDDHRRQREREARRGQAKAEQAMGDAILSRVMSPRTQDAVLRAAFSTAVVGAHRNLISLNPERIADVLDAGDAERARRFVDTLDTWSGQLRSALGRGIRLVGKEGA
ncbi:DUF3102 domain-containing protein [Nocardioides sp.]|uniref:DUF3102 domain-containing protein n=1 Tax=Nocardioides sp. TaxID=35761 RepID=UPI002BF54DCD|nr:DUF3102 domain-containing protein [Nocardioides sp.]HXH79550.1 DUF3102 domain-containing protein [Nocardioides sp.]